LEVLSHVSEQSTFLGNIASLLRPGGILLLATQNRPILERHMNIPPPLPGQIRRWVDRWELEILLQQNFEVLELFTVTPRGHQGNMRIINSPKLNRIIRIAVGDRFDRLRERLGYGWTLMAMAKLRGIDP
jgi:2-polyprenyl-3-methyl-5-hydroxy-6-metoxy-1,4-benzoquinol methylase